MNPEQQAGRQPSPFTPGFNQTPALLVGRDEILDAGDEALATAAEDGRTPTPLLIVGARGVGKTVLLAEVASRAGQRYGWPRLHVEMSPGAPFTPTMLAACDDVATRFETTPRRQRMRRSETVVRAQIAGVGGEVHFTPAPSVAPDASEALRLALRELMAASVDAGAGVVVTLDEMQCAQRGELADLVAVLQEGTGAGWPLVVVGAGLADMRRPDRTVSYLERADWYEIGALSPAETADALQVPAARAGRPFDADALEYLVTQTGGYPFAVQVFGHHAWRASSGQPRITLDAARSGATAATRRLAQGLYTSRWQQCSPKEREYLTAAALLAREGTITGRVVADRLGLRVHQVSYLRDALIKNGTLLALDNELRFAVPGMAEWIRENHTPPRLAHESAGSASGVPPAQQPRERSGPCQRPEGQRPQQPRRGRPGPSLGR